MTSESGLNPECSGCGTTIFCAQTIGKQIEADQPKVEHVVGSVGAMIAGEATDMSPEQATHVSLGLAMGGMTLLHDMGRLVAATGECDGRNPDGSCGLPAEAQLAMLPAYTDQADPRYIALQAQVAAGETGSQEA